MIKVFTDGGARGNPGEGAIGVYITDKKNQKIDALSQKIGYTTNNIAEYKAVIAGLSWLIEHKEEIKNQEIHFYLDSELIYSQISGLYKIKNSNLRTLLFEIREKEAILNLPIKYSYIPREENYHADRLVNLALDNKF